MARFSVRFSLLWLLPALGVGGLGTPSAEAASPKLLALPYQPLQPDLPDTLSEQTTGVIVREIRHGGIDVARAEFTPTTSRRRRGGRSASAASTRAAQLLKGGRADLAEGNLRRAIKRLRRAASTLEEAAPAGADLSLLPQIWLELAVASFRDGEEAEADTALARAAYFDPERRLSESDYPPVFVREYEQAREAVLSRDRARVEIIAPGDARVWLDGRSAGRAPLVLTKVLPGTHWIRIEGPFGTRSRTVRVDSGAELAVEFAGGDEGPGALAGLRKGQLGARGLNDLRARGRAAGADWVLVGVIRGTSTAYEIHSALVHVATGELGQVTEVEFDLDFLSAEIEVYKLAADVQEQLRAGALRAPVREESWIPVPKLLERRRVAGKPRVFVAAPPPPFVRAKPLAVAPRAKPAPSVEVEPERLPPPAEAPLPTETTLRNPPLPEDRVPEPEPENPVAGVTAAPPANEVSESDGDLWWVWVLVGVAAVGAAGAATAVVVSDQNAEEGSLRIRW